MELQKFIEKSLIDVCMGVLGAKDQIYGKIENMPIAPAALNGTDLPIDHAVRDINFDVSVEVSETKKKSSDVGGKIYVVSAKRSGDDVTNNKLVNRIQFSVPFYPQALNHGNEKEGNK